MYHHRHPHPRHHPCTSFSFSSSFPFSALHLTTFGQHMLELASPRSTPLKCILFVPDVPHSCDHTTYLLKQKFYRRGGKF